MPKLFEGPLALIILDGWGLSTKIKGNAIYAADTPNIDRFWKEFPHCKLVASGASVGLPEAEAGNTETGHLNIGAGRIVYQDLPRINLAIADGSYFTNKQFVAAFNHTLKHKSKLHIMGLVGEGGAHSSTSHLLSLLYACKAYGLAKQVIVHLFTDGRDSKPKAGLEFVIRVIEKMNEIGVGRLGSVMGRYFSMDRDKRWERTRVAYKALCEGKGSATQNVTETIARLYKIGITDEFIEPILADYRGKIETITKNDAVIFTNYRVDRTRQLTEALMVNDKTKIENLFFVSMTEYGKYSNVNVAFPKVELNGTLSQVLAENEICQLKVAETEKEKFVGYYLNGQRELEFDMEDRIIVPSKNVDRYDKTPQMSTREIIEVLIGGLNGYEVLIANVAAPDVVAHTGNFEATKQACTIVDTEVGKLVNEIIKKKGICLITADHGNAEEMFGKKSGEVDTNHSTSPVPFMMAAESKFTSNIKLRDGVLADIAPTMLELLGISKFEEMTGRSLMN